MLSQTYQLLDTEMRQKHEMPSREEACPNKLDAYRRIVSDNCVARPLHALS